LLGIFFFECSFKFQEKSPVEFGEVFAKEWYSGVKGGGSGINLFIPVNSYKISFDSAYFRGSKVKLELSKGDNPMYIGRFKINRSDGINLNSNFDKKLRDDNIKKKVSFKLNNKVLYYKISGVLIKKPTHYPSAPPNR